MRGRWIVIGVLVLVSIASFMANAEIRISFRHFSPIEIAKGAVSESTESFINDTSMQHEYLVSRRNPRIHDDGVEVSFVPGIIVNMVIMSGSRVSYTKILLSNFALTKAVIFSSDNFLSRGAIVPFFLREYVISTEDYCVKPRFSTRIIVKDSQGYSISVNDRGDNRNILWANPSAIGSYERTVSVIGGLLGDHQVKPDENEAEYPHDCPYSCDPIQAMGGPNLASPSIALGGLVTFLAAMYLSDRGLERRPFGAQHVGYWLFAIIAGCVCVLAALPIILRAIWPFI